MLRAGKVVRVHAVVVDNKEFSRLDLANEAGTDDIQGTGFRRDNPATFQATQAERANTVGIASGVELFAIGEGQAEGAAKAWQELLGRLDQRGVLVVVVREQRAHDVGVGGV